MPLRKPIEVLDDRAPQRLLLSAAARPLDELLVSGGDGRLDLHAADQQNGYGCTPFPRPSLLEFGSSTASSISPRAYARAQAAQSQMSAAHGGAPEAFDDRMETARDALRGHLHAADAEVVFSPSGTDTQLQALFLVKAILGTPLTTLVVGADQTGGGTAYTAHGQHFADHTSLGVLVEKGAPISGLCEQVSSFGIPFCDEMGKLRSDAEMDAAVYAAVAAAAGRDEKILLQVMDASKLGWRGPSAACLDAVTAAWPDRVAIVVDACQMRIGRLQLNDYLARGYLVMVTGSKFFTGPAFSGALLVPKSLAGAIDSIVSPPPGLGGYTTRYDWPRRWPRLRRAFCAQPNYGQWLRWEATLAEMDAYFTVPRAFRRDLLKALSGHMPQLIAASPNLELVTEHCGQADPSLGEEMVHRTIHAFVPHHEGQPLLPDRTAGLFRAMGRDLSGLLPGDAPGQVRRIAARICQIGQPVALRHRPGAALRLSASARLVSSCWSHAATAEDTLAPVLANVRAVIEKLEWLIANPEVGESKKA